MFFRVRSLSAALLLSIPVASAGAQPPTDPPAPVHGALGERDLSRHQPLPHVVRLDGTGASVQRERTGEDIQPGDHLAFGDRLESGAAHVQVMWSDGTRVSLDRGARLEALAGDLLGLTAGRAVLVRPSQAETDLRVDTPAGSISLAPDGDYRLSVDGESTSVAVARGRADLRNTMGEATVRAGEQLILRDGLSPAAPEWYNAAAFDSFHAWATEPLATPAPGTPVDAFTDPRLEAYTDVFNRHGNWETDVTYGAVWYPTVGNDWRPYHDGHWQTFGQYGWTWVARDPWGWPTHHYGRWGVNPRGRWHWIPGRQWAPSWVSWSVGPGFIGWTPLGYRDRPVVRWDSLHGRRGVYRGGTLDPYRAWTVVPSDRFGSRGRLGAYAVDPRTLTNLQAFVTQRTAPPVRYAVPRGAGVRDGYGYGAGYDDGRRAGARAPRGRAGSRTGDDTTGNLRRGIPPTRVERERPGYRAGPPPQAQDDPYERAREVATPRGRQRQPEDQPAQSAPPPAARRRAPAAERPATAPRAAPRRAEPPPAASTPREGGTRRAVGESTGRRAVPRNPPQ